MFGTVVLYGYEAAKVRVRILSLQNIHIKRMKQHGLCFFFFFRYLVSEKMIVIKDNYDKLKSDYATL